VKAKHKKYKGNAVLRRKFVGTPYA